MPTCINLKERFGRRFKVEYEASYLADRGDGARAADPWLMIVPCRYGHIYPHGGNLLAASVDGYPKVAGVLRRLACCRVYQDGDFGELTVLFDVADFGRVAKVMRPRRRRQVTAEQRETLIARLKDGQDRRTQGDFRPRPCVPASQVTIGATDGQHALFSPLLNA
jgi:hypothetical protein